MKKSKNKEVDISEETCEIMDIDEGFNIENRRYTGSKAKLSEWISNLIKTECEGEVFLDIFEQYEANIQRCNIKIRELHKEEKPCSKA